MAEQTFLTVTKAANRVKRTRRTIDQWISDGELPVVRLDGIRYVREEQLLAVFRAKLAANPNRSRHAYE